VRTTRRFEAMRESYAIEAARLTKPLESIDIEKAMKIIEESCF